MGTDTSCALKVHGKRSISFVPDTSVQLFSPFHSLSSAVGDHGTSSPRRACPQLRVEPVPFLPRFNLKYHLLDKRVIFLLFYHNQT